MENTFMVKTDHRSKREKKSGGKQQYVIQVSEDSQILQRAKTADNVQKRTRQVMKAVLNIPDTAGTLQPILPNLCSAFQGS